MADAEYVSETLAVPDTVLDRVAVLELLNDIDALELGLAVVLTVALGLEDSVCE